MTSCFDCTIKKDWTGEVVCDRFLRYGSAAYHGCDRHDEYCAEGIAGFTYRDCCECDNRLCRLRVKHPDGY